MTSCELFVDQLRGVAVNVVKPAAVSGVGSTVFCGLWNFEPGAEFRFFSESSKRTFLAFYYYQLT